METEVKKIIGDKKGILLSVFIIFLITLIALIIVVIFNKIEYRKHIGQEFRNTITVSGEGEIFAKPDLAMVNFSVISEEKTVNEAIQKNTEKMNAIINFMKVNGIEDRDLRTIAFRIEPRYEWRNGNNEVFPRQNRRVLVGYEVHQTLEVRIRNMEKIGVIIQGGTDLGANQVGSLQFTVDDKDELKNQAREQAIKMAKEQAKVLTDQLNVRIVRIVNFSENYHQPFIPRAEVMREAMPVPMLPEIEPGEEKIQVIVHITYQIK